MYSRLTIQFLIFLVKSHLFTDPGSQYSLYIQAFQISKEPLDKAWVKEWKKVFFLYHPPRECLRLSEPVLIRKKDD